MALAASGVGQITLRTSMNIGGSAALGVVGTSLNNALYSRNDSIRGSALLNGTLGGIGSVTADLIKYGGMSLINSIKY